MSATVTMRVEEPLDLQSSLTSGQCFRWRVDDRERERVAVEVCVVRHLVADPVDPLLHFRIVHEPVLLHSLGCRGHALLEQGGIRDLDGRCRVGRGQREGQRCGDGGPRHASGSGRFVCALHGGTNGRGA